MLRVDLDVGDRDVVEPLDISVRRAIAARLGAITREAAHDR